jgi:hypothetical protein
MKTPTSSRKPIFCQKCPYGPVGEDTCTETCGPLEAWLEQRIENPRRKDRIITIPIAELTTNERKEYNQIVYGEYRDNNG